MDLYIVKGRVSFGEYLEVVEVFENMEEKPKSYVGYSRQFDKSKIGVLKEGMVKGSYQVLLINNEQISDARKSIKNMILEDKMNELEKLNKELSAIKQHSLDSNIKFREG